MQSTDSSRMSPQRTSINVERRFPLDLRQSDQAIRELYEDAKRGRWKPDADIPWGEFNASAHERCRDGRRSKSLEPARLA